MMRIAISFAALLTGCVVPEMQPTTATMSIDLASGLSNGEILFGYRCKGCHDPATPGAPDRKELATYEQREIIAALTRGSMKIMSPGLTPQEMREIAMFLTTARASDSTVAIK